MTTFYRVCRAICLFWLRLSGFHVYGKENVPPDRSLVIVANHSSLTDPIILACAFPYQIFFMAKDEFRQNSFMRWLLLKLGAFFVKRGEADLAAIRSAVQVLQKDRALGIFPEGHRNLKPELDEFKQGPLFIAYRAHVRILPVAIVNANHFMRFWKRNKRVIIGRPMEILSPKAEGGKSLAEYNDELKQIVAELWEKGNNIQD